MYKLLLLIIAVLCSRVCSQEKQYDSCILANGKTGVCVAYYTCIDNKLTWDGVIDIRSKRAVETTTTITTTTEKSNATECPSYLEQCCELDVEPAPTPDLNKVTALPTPPPKKTGKCVMPPHPSHGTYTAVDQTNESLLLNVTCDPGYRALGPPSVYCLEGLWFGAKPRCEVFCKLDSHPSVTYNCLVSKPIVGTRVCNEYEPSGTIVRPECNAPNYYSTYPLHTMRCENGRWNQVFICVPDCGKVTPHGEILVIGGRRAKRGELPWHAGIYTKTTQPYMQICGGSLVSNTIVISAAHCFWNDVDKQLPATNYAVAVGKLYRPWNDKNDVDSQRSDVQDIHLPARFQGGSTNFQDDIAIVVAATAFEFRTYVRPVCLNFEVNFERWQLQPGKKGKAAGWGLTEENGKESQVLKVADLPYVDIEQCFLSSPVNFREYITSDKICAGYNNRGTALCKGDSGGGLAFPELEQGKERYYLRGIVSTAPSDDQLCNANTLTTFTQILKHEYFIKNHLL